MTSRQCSHGDCYSDVIAPPLIQAENYTYVQLKRSKKVKLSVGGKVVLLPGQSVTIRCPVKNLEPRLLFWSRKNRLIPMAGRIKTTFSGNLKIRKANPSSDAGEYTCIAGTQKASVDISFQSKQQARLRSKKMAAYLADSRNSAPPSGQNDVGAVSDPQYNATSRLVFSTSDWSDCSVTCGSGHQRREVTCSLVTERFIQTLPDRECVRVGLARPEYSRKCSLSADCPRWEPGDWSDCTRTGCILEGVSLRKRPLRCLHGNGTDAILEACEAIERPPHRQECPNPDCLPRWTTSKWSRCVPDCAVAGQKTRSLRCIWRKTRLPAFTACKTLPRPVVRKPCKPKRCRNKCEDRSNSCAMVGRLMMCRFRHFQRLCCETCRYQNEARAT